MVRSLSTKIITCLFCLIKHWLHLFVWSTIQTHCRTTCNVHNYDYLPLFSVPFFLMPGSVSLGKLASIFVLFDSIVAIIIFLYMCEMFSVFFLALCRSFPPILLPMCPILIFCKNLAAFVRLVDLRTRNRRQ